jgi:hypothetical protein
MIQLGCLSVTYLDVLKGLLKYKSELQESGSSFVSSTTPNRSVIKIIRLNNYHTIAINGDSEISSSGINNLILHNLRKISFLRIYETDPLSCIVFLFCFARNDGRKVILSLTFYRSHYFFCSSKDYSEFFCSILKVGQILIRTKKKV